MKTKQKTLDEAAATETSTGKKEKKKTQKVEKAKETTEIKPVELGTVKEFKGHESIGELKTNLDDTKDKNSAKKKPLVRSILCSEKVITESSDEARSLNNQSCFGSAGDNGKIEMSLLEGLYLMEKGKIEIKSEAGRKISFESFVRRARKIEPNFWTRYRVFKDIRNRGYIIKTALKFGADFRVYDRGVKPGEDHARWIVYPVHEGETLTWYEFAAKNRVAHSTKKRLLMGIVDDEGDVTYYEIRWLRP